MNSAVVLDRAPPNVDQRRSSRNSISSGLSQSREGLTIGGGRGLAPRSLDEYLATKLRFFAFWCENVGNRLNEQFSRIFPSKMRFLRCGVFLRPARLERATYGSGGRRSIQLNYGRE